MCICKYGVAYCYLNCHFYWNLWHSDIYSSLHFHNIYNFISNTYIYISNTHIYIWIYSIFYILVYSKCMSDGGGEKALLCVCVSNIFSIRFVFVFLSRNIEKNIYNNLYPLCFDLVHSFKWSQQHNAPIVIPFNCYTPVK